jgi:hypothetical protein
LAINVTVLGAADGTITIPFTSATNAAVAQTALAGISMAVAADALTQFDYTGTETLPAATTQIGLVVQGSTALAPLVIGNNVVAAVLNGAAVQTVVTGVNSGQVIVSGAAGGVVDNLGSNTQVLFGGGNNSFAALGNPLLDIVPTAQVYLDGTGTFDVSFGATTIFAGTGAAVNVINNGDASNTVDLEAANLEAGNPEAGGLANSVALSGAAVTAATVNAAGAGLSVVQNGGAGLINANDSNVTIYGVTPGDDGSVTLFGGTGTDSVTDGSGLFRAGSGGGSVLVGSTLPGGATLIGGGAGDTLQGLGGGDLMVAGSGNETLLGGFAPVVAIGFGGADTGATNTDMTGGTSGGNTFFVGNGTTSITGNHGADGGNAYVELTAGPKTVVITDFVSALDASGMPVANADLLSMAMPGGGVYQFESDAVPAANEVSLAYLSIGGSIATELQFGDGATWTLFNCMLQPGDFH